MEGDGLLAEGEFLVFIWLVLRTTGESRVRQNSGRFGMLDFILDGYFRVQRGSTIGEGGDAMISSPGRSPKQPLPGMRLHDPLHGQQACPNIYRI